jgi:hypothetical protein
MIYVHTNDSGNNFWGVRLSLNKGGVMYYHFSIVEEMHKENTKLYEEMRNLSVLNDVLLQKISRLVKDE